MNTTHSDWKHDEIKCLTSWRGYTRFTSTPERQQSAQVWFHPSLPVYFSQKSRERTAWLRSASFIKNDPCSGPTGGHQFTRLACVGKKRTIRWQKRRRRLCGHALPARRPLCFSPRLHIRALRARSRLKEWFFSGTVSISVLPDTAAGVRAEREDQGPAAADLDSPVETQGCSAPSSGAPGGSPLRLRLLSTHLRTHTHGLSCPWLQLPSPAHHDIVQAAVLMLLAAGQCGGGGMTGREDGECEGPAPTLRIITGGWLRWDYEVGV